MELLTCAVGGLALFGQAALAAGNLFHAMVDIPNWRQAASLKAYRAATTQRNAGNFFRVISPLTTLLSLAFLVLGWGAATRNGLMTVSLLACVMAEVVTVVWFFPRNAQLFTAPIEVEPGPASRQLVDQWSRANAIRVAVMAVGWGCGLTAFSLTTQALASRLAS